MATARTLAKLGADVVVVDAREGPAEHAHAEELAALGVRTRLGVRRAPDVPAGTNLVVTSPGWRPDHPLLVASASAGVPVWGEVELAWRLRDPATPWLAVTGTNGKTTTVRMLASVLAAAGYRTVAAGNVGLPLLDAVQADPPYDVIAAELSSYQLHWASSLECEAAAVLNVAPDHIDWHGSFDGYAAAKARIWSGSRCVVFNADDPVTRRLADAVPDDRDRSARSK
ncbi:MAG: Mur ligase family protein, partial [Chloroflexota bacterium]|nr:Mur ligase family protein [Chloroflexota bacterium]